MTINDQIKDEKLQYDINWKAVEKSALSSGKIGKYEYLTGNEILPSNQQQIMEQAKFTYFSLGKAFEKQIKTIQNQGQVKTIKYIYVNEDTPLISKQIFNELVDERLEEITDLDEKINSDNLYTDTKVGLLMQTLINLIMLLILSIKKEMVKQVYLMEKETRKI